MFELSYWNPPKQVVVEGMHNLLEGIVPVHVLDGLRLVDSSCCIQPPPPPAFSFPFKTLPAETSTGYGSSGEQDGRPLMSRKHPKPHQVDQIHVQLTARYSLEDEDDRKSGEEERGVLHSVRESSVTDASSVAYTDESDTGDSLADDDDGKSAGPHVDKVDNPTKTQCRTSLMKQTVPSLRFVLQDVWPAHMQVNKGYLPKSRIVDALLQWVSSNN